MQLIRELSQLPSQLQGGAVTVGNFDGVHRGHAQIVGRLIQRARQVQGPALVFTFDPHPVRVLRPDLAPPPLTWTERKAFLFGELGIDAMIACPTDEALLALTPEAFFDQVILGTLQAQAMVEGPNFFFGRDRSGSVDELGQLCRQHGLGLDVVEPITRGETYISSSRIRAAIRSGAMGEARKMLTRPYRIRGMVTHGAARGAKIGFPTANLEAIDTLLPSPGVYAGGAVVEEQTFPAAINLGPNPTFAEQALKVEVHLLDFDGTLYGRPLEVDFLARLRDIERFGSVEQLKLQLRRDIQAVRRIFDEGSQANADDVP